MGCDIHTRVEVYANGQWNVYEQDKDGYSFLAEWRSYRLFGFLANVRNYSAIPPISKPRGLCPNPNEDVSEAFNDFDYHSFSWLSLSELLAFNYDQPFEDRRVTTNNNGGCTAEPGGGTMTTYREFLGTHFFADLETLKQLEKPCRLVFWFDS